MKLSARTKLRAGIGLAAFVVLLLALVAALLTVFGNNRKFADLQERAKSLETHAKGGVKNESYVSREEALTIAYTKQLNVVKEELVARDKLIEQPFRDDVNNVDPPLEYGDWKVVYEKKTDDLYKTLRDSVIMVGAQPLVRTQLDEVWKPAEWMHQHEKAYWIQKAVVDAIAELNATQKVVPVFESFAFTNVPEHIMQTSHQSGQFDCIPFSLQVQMEFVRVPELLQALLDSGLGLEITSVSVLSRGSAGFAARPTAPAQWSTGAPTAGGTQQYAEDEEEIGPMDVRYKGRTTTVSPSAPAQPQPQPSRQTPRAPSSRYVAPPAGGTQQYTQDEEEIGPMDVRYRGGLSATPTPGMPRQGTSSVSTRRVRSARGLAPSSEPAPVKQQYARIEDELAQGPRPDWAVIGPVSRSTTPSRTTAAAPARVPEAPNPDQEAREYERTTVQQAEETIPRDMVNVVVNGYVPDYLQPVEKTTEEDQDKTAAPGE